MLGECRRPLKRVGDSSVQRGPGFLGEKAYGNECRRNTRDSKHTQLQPNLGWPRRSLWWFGAVGSDQTRMPEPQVDQILATTIYVDGANRPFGELTLDQVRARADELKAATGWGPTARVAPVARAWRELSMALEKAGLGTVGELDQEALLELAPQLWVVPPGGSLMP
jgi:hypothetical protein